MHSIGFFAICLMAICNVQGQHIQLKKYYEGQNLLHEVYFVKDTNSYVLDGEYMAFYANGKIKTKGSYENNHSVGTWEYFFENGAIKMRGHLEDYGKSGFWEYYFENGRKSMEGLLIEGKRDGDWNFYYEQGGVKSKGGFVNGARQGTWEYFNEDGSLKAEAKFDKDVGMYSEFYRSGNLKAIGKNKYGRSDSLWQYFYDNKKLKAAGYYRDGIREGQWKYYHENGKLASMGTYENGVTTGLWTYYHENGVISSQGEEKDGIKDGFWKLYHKSGVYKGESTFMLGEGPYKEYYPGGSLKIDGFIKNDKNEGQWKYYYEDGKLEGECFFVDGEGQFKGYYKNGKLRMEGTIKDGINIGLWKLYKQNGDLAGYYTTVYNDDGQIEYALVPSDSIQAQENGQAVIPEFLFKNRKSRYFVPKINEFKSIILATNPTAMVVGSIPFSVEYYFQERLGYELFFHYVRMPFFTGDAKVPFNEIYKRGYAIRLRQKFYQKDQRLGMLYFGHEISFSSNKYSSNIEDLGLPNGSFVIDAKENLYEYSIIVGNRMMKYAGRTGITLDIYGGVGLGYRNYFERFPPESQFVEIFDDVRKPKLSIPFRLGINLGYAF